MFPPNLKNKEALGAANDHQDRASVSSAAVTLFGFRRSDDLPHWPDTGRGQTTAFRLKVSDYVLNHLTQLTVQLNGVVAMDARDHVGAPADVHPVLFAPLDPFVVPGYPLASRNPKI